MDFQQQLSSRANGRMFSRRAHLTLVWHDNANPIAPKVYSALDLPGGRSLSQLLKGRE